MWDIIFPLYSIISVFMLMFYIPLLNPYDYEVYSWKNIFAFQYALYRHMKDKLNIFGIAILETIITILTFGATAAYIVTIITVGILVLIWKLFCFIFKKR